MSKHIVTLVWFCTDCGRTGESVFKDTEPVRGIEFYPILHQVRRLHDEAVREDGEARPERLDIRSIQVSLDYEPGSELCSGNVKVGFVHA
jgi:hypothetical protein